MPKNRERVHDGQALSACETIQETSKAAPVAGTFRAKQRVQGKIACLKPSHAFIYVGDGRPNLYMDCHECAHFNDLKLNDKVELTIKHGQIGPAAFEVCKI